MKINFLVAPLLIVFLGIIVNIENNSLAGQCTSESGTLNGISSFIGESNRRDLNDTVFLCWQDRLYIQHNGDYNVTGDPNPSTPGGIGYGWYTDRPVATGNTLNTIRTTDDIFRLNDDLLNWKISVGDLNGNIMFENSYFSGSQSFNSYVNNGLPTSMYYAPVTIDYRVGKRGYHEFEGGVKGPCVKASPDESFLIVYLNPIEISNIEHFVSGDSIEISFWVSGGSPEYYDRFGQLVEYQSIEIIDFYSHKVVKTLPVTGVTHNTRVTFKVKNRSTFEILVTDKYGCNESNLLILTENTNPTLKLDTISVKVGDIDCLKFDALNFDNPLYALGRIDFDPTVIQFHSVQPSGFSGYFRNETPGLLLVDFPIPGTAWPDDLYLCFTAIGKVGDCSPVNLTYFELINNDIEEFLPNTQHGLVCIEAPDGLYVSTRFCGSESLFTPDANITFQVHNGIAPYVYEVRQVIPFLPDPVVTGTVLNPNIETDVFGLYAGRRYTITVTDNNGTGSSFTTPEIFISTTPPLEFESVEIHDPTCYGFRDGSIIIDVKDGEFFPYIARWSTNVFNTDTLRYLGSGNYGITITDRTTGCRTDTLVNLFVPRLNVEWELVEDASCSGVNDGIVIARVSGGTPDPSTGYTYKWKNIGQLEVVDTDFIESTFSNAAAGQLILVYHDNYRYCNDTAFIDVGTKYTMTASDPVITNPTCNGAGDGSVSITPELTGYSGPEYALRYITWPPYPYERIGDEFILTNLDGRRYIIELEETNTGCTIRDTMDLLEPAPINAWVSNVTNTGCLPGQTAQATVTVLNGIVPVTLSGIGSDVTLTGTSHTFTGLDNGDYKVFIEDANGCIDSVEFSVNTAPGLLRIDSIYYEPLGCSLDATTDIIVYATTSHGAITYRWSDPDGNPLGTNSNILSDVGAGTYIIELEDLFPCLIHDTITIEQSSPFDYTKTTIPSECGPGETGGIPGEACITIDGDDSGFTFTWSNGMTGRCANGLFAGEYTVTISDGLGCDIVETVIIDGGPVIETEILALMGVSCHEGTADGAIALIAAGGTNPSGQYTFAINGGTPQIGNVVSFANLQGGPNTLTVSYNTPLGNVCTKSEIIDVPIPERIVLDMVNSAVNMPTCNGDCDGSAVVQASGGNNANYFYNWPHSGQDGAVISGLCAGTYSIEITDANLCTVTESIEVTQPDELIIAIGENTKDINCFGGNTGEIHIDYSGGNTEGPYSFDWSPDVSESSVATNLAAGNYSVTVTDYKGCSNSITYELSEQAPITFDPLQDGEIKCYGEQTCITVENVSGGSGISYTFSINGGAIFPIDDCRNVFASDLPYLVTVFDSDGCRADREILITQPEKIEVDLGERLVIDLGESDIVTLITNAVIAEVEWDINTLYNTFEFINSQQTEIEIESTADNIIYATVTDTNGCEATGELQILVNTVRNVYVPNIFTPDGDGINDLFRIKAGKGVERVNYIRVFDRWGERIYNEENILPSGGYAGNWNGTYKGQKLNTGVYVYTIEVLFNDNREIVYRGSITLLR